MHLDTPAGAREPYAARRMNTPTRIRLAALAGALLVVAAVQAAGPPRAEALAKFDAGYAQCEQRFPDMRGQRDKVYAGLYRLRLDDATVDELKRVRQSTPYKNESQRAARALKRNTAASDVSARLDQQCRGLQREAAR